MNTVSPNKGPVGSIIVSSVILALLLSFFAFVLYNIFKTPDYYKGTNWDQVSSEFDEVYIPAYQEKIDELLQQYGLTCESRIEKEVTAEGDTKVTIYVYNSQSTMRFRLSNLGSRGHYKTDLFYYGMDANDFYNRSTIEPYVHLINDFTRFAAYDTKNEESDNHFLRLYDECVSGGTLRKDYESYTYYYDSLIGNVGYGINMKREAGYFYMAKESSDAGERMCVHFDFEGLLKPLSNADGG